MVTNIYCFKIILYLKFSKSIFRYINFTYSFPYNIAKNILMQRIKYLLNYLLDLLKEINNFYTIQILLSFTTILALSLILAGLCDIIESNSYKTGE